MRNPRPFLILLVFLILTLALAFAAGPDRAPALAEKGAAATGANSPENPAGMDHPLPTAVPASSEQSLVSRAVDSVAEGQQTEKLNGARRGASDEGLESETNTQAGESAPAEGEAGQQMENAAISTADVTASPTRFPSPSPTTPPSPTPSPTPIPSPTPTPQPTWTPWPTNTPTPVPTPQFVNGMSSEAFIIMDEDTRQHIRDIYYQGQEKGRNPQGLSRIGASIIETDQFLLRFGIGNYDLGPYQHLQPVVEYFASSFARYGVGIRRGLTAWMVLDPSRVDESVCLPGETMLVCEIRLNNPSILILVLGTNDIGAVERFEESMRAIIEYTVGQGVIPILATKADRYEGGENRNNLVLHRLANEYDIPLWDFDIVAETLPGKGLARDNVHLTFLIDFDYNDPLALERGYGVYNLTALIMLDEVLREMKATVLDSSHIPE